MMPSRHALQVCLELTMDHSWLWATVTHVFQSVLHVSRQCATCLLCRCSRLFNEHTLNAADPKGKKVVVKVLLLRLGEGCGVSWCCRCW